MTETRDVPFDFETIPQLLEKSVERFGDSHAIEDGDVTLTFTELAEKVEEAIPTTMAALKSESPMTSIKIKDKVASPH